MNDLYTHQLETENKQLREVLKSTNEVVKEYLEKEKYCDELENRIDKAIEYIKEHKDENNYVFLLPSELQVILSILGDKENE